MSVARTCATRMLMLREFKTPPPSPPLTGGTRHYKYPLRGGGEPGESFVGFAEELKRSLGAYTPPVMIFPVGLLVHGLGLEGLGLGIQILELAGFVGTAAYGPWFLFGLELYSKN